MDLPPSPPEGLKHAIAELDRLERSSDSVSLSKKHLGAIEQLIVASGSVAARLRWLDLQLKVMFRHSGLTAARTVLDQMLAMPWRACAPAIQARVLLSSSVVAYYSHDYSESGRLAAEAGSVLGDQDEPLLRARTHQLRAISALQTLPPESSEPIVMLALMSARASESLRLLGDALQNAAFIQAQLGQLDQARELVCDAIHVHQQQGFLGSEAHALHMLAGIDRNRGEPVSAIKAALNGAALARISDQPRIEALCLLMSSLIYANSNSHEEAKIYAVRALVIADKLNNRMLAAQGHYALAEIALVNNDHDTASEHVEAIFGSEVFAQNNDLHNGTLLIAARLQLARGAYAAAARLLEAAAALPLGALHQQQRQQTLAALLLAQGAVDAAAEALADLSSTPTRSSPLGDDIELASLRSQIAEAQGDHKTALAHLRSSLALQRSVERAQSSRRTKLVRASQAVDEVERQLSTLQAQHDELRGLAQRLHATTMERDLLLRTLAHDLRSPMTAISLNLYMLRDDADTPERTEQLSLIQESVDQIVGDLDAALARSRSASRGLQPVALQELLAPLVASHRPKAQWKEIALVTDFSPTTVSADPWLLRHAATNLLSNALKYTPRGGQVTLRCGSGVDGGSFLEVVDTGPGLTNEELTRIFQPYQTGEAKPTGGETALGLGLSLTRHFAESCGADLTATATPGAGASFSIRWRSAG